MLYTVYKVTNIHTQEFYIGVHKTDDPNDGYLGSGKIIRAQVAEHGPESFRKEILATFQKRHEAYALEATLVSPLLGTPGFLNLHPGGKGGFGYINTKGLSDPRRASLRHQEKLKTDPQYREAHRAKVVAKLKGNKAHCDRLRAQADNPYKGFHGQKHTPESLRKISEARRRCPTPTGVCQWVCNPLTQEARRVPLEDAAALMAQGWVRGRKVPT